MVKIKPPIVAKVNGSTILEVVIAMAVIVFVLGMALMIFSNVTRLSLSAKKLKTASLLRSEMTEISVKGNLRDTIFNIEDNRIEQTVSKNDWGAGLYTVDLKATDQNSVIVWELKKIIRQHDQ